MTRHQVFTDEEWRTVLEGPPAAGMVVVTASSGGMFKETFAMSKAYAEARAGHGQSELLDEIVAARPKVDHPKAQSQQEFQDLSLQHLREAVALVQSKATPEEVEGYRRFVLAVADKVANAHREDGQDVSPEEAEAISRIAEAVGATSP